MSEDASEKTPIDGLGFWHIEAEPPGMEAHLPRVEDWVDPDWDPAEREQVARYVQRGTFYEGYMGYSSCRICRRPNGTEEFTDGTYLWPSGLAHYLLEHQVRLPERFCAHVRERLEVLRGLPIDAQAWWATTAGWDAKGESEEPRVESPGLAEMASVLTPVGYWDRGLTPAGERGRPPNVFEFLHPFDVDSLPRDEWWRYAMTLEYVRRGTEISCAESDFPCRVCDAPNGRRELTDGTFVWPEGLLHYIEKHNLRVPQAFERHIHSRLTVLEKVRGSMDWWLQVKPEFANF